MRTRWNSDEPIRTASGSERVCEAEARPSGRASATRLVTPSLTVGLLPRTRSLTLAVLRARPFDAARLMRAALFLLVLVSFPTAARADKLRLSDGTTMEVDEAWGDAP